MARWSIWQAARATGLLGYEEPEWLDPASPHSAMFDAPDAAARERYFAYVLGARA